MAKANRSTRQRPALGKAVAAGDHQKVQENLEKLLSNLAYVFDLLHAIENDQLDMFGMAGALMLARSAFAKVGNDLERELFDLGLIDVPADGGCFIRRWPLWAASEMEVAHAR